MDTATADLLRKEIERERARNAPPVDFPDLPPIPRARYTDPAFHELERTYIFDRSWLYAGSGWELPEAGDYKSFDNFGRAPILLLRGKDMKVRAFYNTCQHRGATITREPCGKAGSRLKCQFHSWTYDLEGKLVGIPGPWDFSPDLDKSQHNLKPVRCEMWGEHIFINFDDGAPDLLTFLGPVAVDFEWASGLRPSNRRSRVMACNWRIAIEAFIEVYHITTIHPGSVADSIDYRGTVSSFFPNGHSRMIVPSTPKHYQAPPEVIPEDWDEGRALRGEANVSYHIFPNLLTPASQTGYMLMEFWPLDHNHTEIVTWVVDRDWGEGAPPPEYDQRGAYFDTVLDEDTWNMEHIQHSLLSPAFAGPKCSYHEKRIYYLEEHVDKALGVERVPEHLRVKPLLSDRIVTTAGAV